MRPEYDPVSVSDRAELTEADWLQINKIRSAYNTGRSPALGKALEDFCKEDVICYIRVLNAILPNQIRERIKEDVVSTPPSGTEKSSRSWKR